MVSYANNKHPNDQFDRDLLDKSIALAKPASEDKDSCNRYNKTLVPRNRMTPVIRCKIEAMAAKGNLIVVISKFTVV